MKNPVRLTLMVFVLVLAFLACSNPTGPGPSDDSGPPDLPAGQSRILFSMAVSAVSSIRSPRAAGTAGAGSETDLYWYDLLNGGYGYQPLQPGENSVDLSKNGIYVLSIVEKNQPGIISRGFIGIANVGLESLPIAAGAEDLIDLGSIDGNFQSYIGSSAVADLLGYDVDFLRRLRGFDSTFKKFLNPDINQNNVYDISENISWNMSGQSFRHLQTDLYDLATGSMTLGPGDLDRPGFTYVFNIYQGIPVTLDTSEVTLSLPADADVLSNGGAPITEMTEPRYFGPEDEPGHNPQYYFSAAENDIDLSYMPVNGDFVLGIDGSQYHLNNLEFAGPEGDYEGYTFALFEYTRNAVGAFKEIRWKWKTVKDGQIVDANPEEVKIKATKIQIYLGKTPKNYRPEDFGINYWQNGSIHVEHFGAILSDHPDYSDSSNDLRTSYWGRALNNFAYRFTADDYPVNAIVTSRELFPVEDTYDDILGVWENIPCMTSMMVYPAGF